MRRISFFFFSTLSALVLLFSYRTSLGDATVVSSATSAHAHVVSGTAAADSITPGSATASAPIITVPSSTSAAAAPAPAAAAPAPAAAAPAAPAAATVIDGDSVNTSYGPVQVEITVAGGVITDVQAIHYPNNDGEDRQINSRALPLLNSKVLSAQSAKIDGVSGATYTSVGYLRSLQSAIDIAGL